MRVTLTAARICRQNTALTGCSTFTPCAIHSRRPASRKSMVDPSAGSASTSCEGRKNSRRGAPARAKLGKDAPMLDIIASIALGSLYTAVAGVLTSYAPISPRTRFSLLGGLGLWVVFVGFIAAYGGFLPGTTGPVPAVVLAFGAMLGAGLLAWFLIPRFRDALLAIPLPALIG